MKNVILDIDNTLICSIHGDARYKFELSKVFFESGHPDIFHMFENYTTRKRQHLDEFLDFCFENFNVGIWTISQEDYALEVLKNINIDKNDLKWFQTRNDCQYIPKIRQWFKPINRISEDVIMIDDKPYCIEGKKSDTVIPIKVYYGEDGDTELLSMIDTLKEFV